MREILFRGKRIDNGEWIEGNLIQYPLSSYSYVMSNYGFDDAICVLPETVGQFTNMTDCINNLLFEGDLVNAFDDKKCEFDQSYIGIVKFVGGAFGVEWHAKNFQTFMPFRDIESNIMLVGNIFDNPEMLKSETLAEFQPVIHAKWVRVRIYCDEYGCINEIFRCSNCKIPRDRKFSFCPSCGAKMDGD